LEAVFGVVADEARRVCDCACVAIATDDHGVTRVSCSAGEEGATLPAGMAVDGTLAAAVTPEVVALRFVPAAASGAVAEWLAARGFGAVLAVPLPVPGGTPALLLL